MDSQYALIGLQLLYADTSTIKNYCRTSTVARNICNSVDFWLEKFDNDNIPIIGLNVNNKTTGKDYMKEYIKVTKAQDQAVAIINYIVINNHPVYKSIHFYMDMDDPNYLKMFPIEHQYSILEQKKKLNILTDALLSLNLNENVKKNLRYDILGKKSGTFLSLSLLQLSGHIPDTLDFLTKLFYYYPYQLFYYLLLNQ